MGRMQPSILEPMTPAWARMKLILFQPFDMGKWFCIGFSAWLMTLTEGGASMGSNVPIGEDNSFLLGLFEEHFILMTTLCGLGVILGLGLFILCIWLSCRGRFMFLYQLANNSSAGKKTLG